MKFYRVSYSVHGGNSGGFSWHTSKRAAIEAAKKDYDQDPREYNNQFTPEDLMRVVDIKPTKAGILEALSFYASHPDNG